MGLQLPAKLTGLQYGVLGRPAYIGTHLLVLPLHKKAKPLQSATENDFKSRLYQRFPP